MKTQLLQVFAIAILTTVCATKGRSQAWSINGNAGISATTNFLGTTDAKPLVFRTSNIERMRITTAGLEGIGTSTPVGKLNVDGGSSLSLSAPGYVVVGNPKGFNIGIDVSEIQARSNHAISSLYLNNFGGTTFIGSNSKSTTGLVANGTSYGLSGFSSNSGSTGVNGVGPSADGFGVAGSGYYGTYGYSSSGGYGIYGQGANGSYGVEGYSNTSIGVYGATGNSNSYAGFFVGNVFTTGNYSGSDAKLKQNIHDFS